MFCTKLYPNMLHEAVFFFVTKSNIWMQFRPYVYLHVPFLQSERKKNYHLTTCTAYVLELEDVYPKFLSLLNIAANVTKYFKQN